MKKKLFQLAVLLVLWLLILPYLFRKLTVGEVSLLSDSITAVVGIIFMRDSFKARPKFKTFVMWLILGFAFILAESAVTGYLFNKFHIVQTTNDARISQAIKQSPLAILLSGCIAAPFTEEIIFRGYIFSITDELCERKRLSPTSAYLFSSAVFAAMHSPSSLVMAVPYFFAGLIFAAAYDQGSIHCSIGVHMLNNMMALL